MNVYATNSLDAGYDFQGSFTSLEEAQENAQFQGADLAHWWADDQDGPRPEWAAYPNEEEGDNLDDVAALIAAGALCPDCGSADTESNGYSEHRCVACDHRWGRDSLERGERYGY